MVAGSVVLDEAVVPIEVSGDVVDTDVVEVDELGASDELATEREVVSAAPSVLLLVPDPDEHAPAIDKAASSPA